MHRCQYKITFWHKAAYHGHMHVVVLTEHNADIEEKNSNGCTFLICDASDVVHVLLPAGANLQEKSYNGETALISVVLRFCATIIQSYNL